ncbi:MAG: DMT family transporter [Bacteroidales bacterium]|jgi:drug/metabolite transporter (DMT)-like permease|nr:DMT family transporter [Bacteroidales bacterium]
MNTEKAPQQKAYLLALVAVVFWSTMSSAFKITLRHIPFDQLLMWSSLMGVIVLFTINQVSAKRLKISDINGRALMSSAIMGLFNPFLYYLVLFKSYELLEAQIAGTLNYTWPIALVLLSIPFLKQKISGLSLVAIFISFIGIIIISTKGNITDLKGTDPLGVSLAVGSAFFWAIYWILNMKDKREETGKIMFNLVFGFLYIFIYMLISGVKLKFPGTSAFIGIIYIGMFEMSITFVIWLKALNLSSDTAKVSNLIYLSPFLALFIIHMVVGEEIHVSTVIGLVFIVAGIIFQQMLGRRRKRLK